MERVTFRRQDVVDQLSTMVCMKLDAGGDTQPPLARRFSVSAFPTIVLLDPLGKTIYHDSGAPSPDDFARFFAIDKYNQAIQAYNRKDYKALAPDLFFVTKWFGKTKLGKNMQEIHQQLLENETYVAAWKRVKDGHERRVTEARNEMRERVRKEKERRDQAKAALAKADELYGKYMKNSAYKQYRKVILQFPETPEADRARAILRKHKKKWKEPAKK